MPHHFICRVFLSTIFYYKKCNNTFCNMYQHSYSFLMKRTSINSEIPRPENRNTYVKRVEHERVTSGTRRCYARDTNVFRFVYLRISTIILLSEIISLETAMQIKLYNTRQLWHPRWLRLRIYLPLPRNEAVSVPKEQGV